VPALLSSFCKGIMSIILDGHFSAKHNEIISRDDELIQIPPFVCRSVILGS
jgi:hypothetical protein